MDDPKPKNLSWSKILLVAISIFLLVGSYWFIQSSQVSFTIGSYSIAEAVVTNQTDEQGQPLESGLIFAPSDAILGWVRTEGAEGTIGFRWFYGSELLVEHFGKTTNNQIASVIQGQESVLLGEGQYRLELFYTPMGPPQQVIEFTVARPELSFPTNLATPQGHEKLEPQLFSELSFAWAETWVIDDEEWQINEVKVVLVEEKLPTLVIVVPFDKGLTALTETEIEQLAKPLALYALQNDYLETAKQVELKGGELTYQYLFINFVDMETGKMYRQPFEIELLQSELNQ